MIRFDKSVKVMEERRVVKIKKGIEITPEYNLLQDTSFTFPTEDLKILVIGDSYIFGGGIEFEANFSQNLKRLINSEKGNFKTGWVLDASQPASNNLDNNLTYFQFVNSFNPDIVIIGYHIDDVMGNLQKDDSLRHIADFPERHVSAEKNKTLINRISDILYTSELVRFILQKIHDELKAYGYFVPGSQADIITKSYWQEKGNWIQSKKLLSEIIDHSKENGIQLVIYSFPEINLIEYPELFLKSNKAISDFFENHPSVFYIDGFKNFRNEKAKDYRLSKYDGHPNAEAHKKIAEEVFRLIKETNAAYKNLNELEGE